MFTVALVQSAVDAKTGLHGWLRKHPGVVAEDAEGDGAGGCAAGGHRNTA